MSSRPHNVAASSIVRVPVGRKERSLGYFLRLMIPRISFGFALSPLKKIEQARRNHGELPWKPDLHLVRVLLTGAATSRDGSVPMRLEAHRERLLAVKRGEMPWAEVDTSRKGFHRDFERPLVETILPERPDYEAANRFLIKARREMAEEFRS